MPKIKKIIAREILDSQGDSAIEVSVFLENGIKAKSSLSCDLPAIGEGRKGFNVDVAFINKNINQELKGLDVTKQVLIDERLTLTSKDLNNESCMAISIACARTSAICKKKELYQYLAKIFKNETKKFSLPTPVFGIFNGGRHADTNLDFEGFSIIPLFDGTFSRKLEVGSAIFKELGKVLHEANFDTDTGAEGGYAPDIRSSIQAMELMMAAIIRTGFQPGPEIGLGIDIGSSQIFNKNTGRYVFRLDKTGFTNSTLVGLYHEWLRMFPIFMIEDGLGEDDWSGWKELTRELGRDIILAGDDFFSADSPKLRRGATERVANTVVVKISRFRTLYQVANFIAVARTNGYGIIISHSYGETGDDFIADLAVAIGADYFKSGSLSRWERVVKYNRLTEIEGLILNK